jgi:epoxyqueuosine reductase
VAAEGELRAERTRAVKAQARAIGFDKVGIAAAGPADPQGRLRAWLHSGFHGGLRYMEQTAADREDVRRFVPGAKSVVALAIAYSPLGPSGPIARYARGDDYHRVLQKKVRRLRAFLLRLDPEARVGPSVDTAPVLERAWAERAGITWIGKSTMAIATDLGTYSFLATLITTTELDPDPPHPDRCGSCTACLDACPTGAFAGPHRLDARRCITTWNVEHRGPFPPEAPPLHGWVAGCDVCQEVCPWNKFAGPTRERRFAARPALEAPNLVEWARSEQRIAADIRGTALMRTGPAALARNAERVLAESSLDSETPRR